MNNLPVRSLIGVGVDLAELGHVARSIRNIRFLDRVYAPEEIAHLVASPACPDIRRLGEAFALKEAFLKALGTGWSRGIEFREIAGVPVASPGSLVLSGRAESVAQEMGVQAICVSAQSVGAFAVAVVFLYGLRSDGFVP